MLRFSFFSRQELFLGWQRFVETGIFSADAFDNIGKLAVQEPFSLFLALFIFLTILFVGGFLIWLTIVSQAAIVNNSAKAIGRKKHNFKEGLDAGIKNFWTVFGLNIALKLIIYIPSLIIGVRIRRLL